MHYPSGDAFDTMDPGKRNLVGNRMHLSQGDVLQILDQYQCKSKAVPTPESTLVPTTTSAQPSPAPTPDPTSEPTLGCLTFSKTAGRCGPQCGGRCAQAKAPYCNVANGWCGSTDAHKNAQIGYEYDFHCSKNLEEIPLDDQDQERGQSDDADDEESVELEVQGEGRSDAAVTSEEDIVLDEWKKDVLKNTTSTGGNTVRGAWSGATALPRMRQGA